jgi:hypothetical protein
MKQVLIHDKRPFTKEGAGLPPLFSQSKNCEDAAENPAEPETACALRTRPPPLFGLEPLYIMVAITFSGLSTSNCNRFDCAI